MSSILIRYPNAKIAQLVERQTENLCVGGSIPSLGTRIIMEDNAAGLVLRLALKTRFSEMGWGSTPLLSANNMQL